MLNLLRRTRLYEQISDVINSYRALKRAEHRSALKLKRAAVKARIRHEVQRAHVEQMVMYFGAAGTIARVQAARAAAISKAGVKVQETGVGETITDKADADYKKRAVEAVESIFPGDGPGREIAGSILRQSVHDVRFDGEMPRGAQLIAGVARQAGVEWKELEEMVEIVEKDEEGRRELKQMVKQAMDEQDRQAMDEQERQAMDEQERQAMEEQEKHASHVK